MTCIIQRPEPQELFDRVKQMFSANVLGGAPVVPDTNEWYAVSNDYLAQEVWYSTAEQMLRETDPRYACHDNLITIAARYGIYPRPASFARGYVKLTGTPGARLSPGIAVQFEDAVYRVDPTSTVPAQMPDTGQVILRMVSDTPGPLGSAGSALTTSGRIISPLTGIAQAVEIYGGRFCNGRDAETGEEFRVRVLQRLSHGWRANLAGVTGDLLEYPCVTRVLPRDCECCTERGRLDLFVFMDDTFANGIPPQLTLDEMTDWYFGRPQGFGLALADIGQEGRFYAAKPVRVNITVSNLPCTSPAQMEEVRQRIVAMMAGLTPGHELCRRMIDACVIQTLGYVCGFDVAMVPATAPLTDPESYKPACDELPVAGTIHIMGGSLTL